MSVIAILSLVTLAFVMLSVYDFYLILEKKEYEFQKGLLRDLSIQSGALVDIKLQGYISTLYGLAEFIGNQPLQTDENLKRFQDVLSHEEFRRLGVVSKDGVLWTTDGKNDMIVDISDRSYWKQVLNGEVSISEVRDSRITAERVFFIAVPVITSKGEFHGAIHAAIDIEDFQMYTGTRLGLSDYNVYMLDSEGDYVIRCPHHEKSWDYKSFFDFFHENGSGIDVEMLNSMMNSSELIVDDIIIEGVDYIACFAPLELNRWYVVVTIPKEEINVHIESLLDKSIYLLVAKLFISLSILCFVIIYYTRKDALQQRNKEIQVREKLFSDIDGFIQADLVDNRVIYSSDTINIKYKSRMTYKQLMESYIESTVQPEHQMKLLHATAAQNLLDLHEKGINRISLEYLVHDSSGNSLWNQCEIHVEKDSNTSHPCIYYVIKDIDEKKRREQSLKAQAERDELTGLFNRSVATDKINQTLIIDSANTDNQHIFIILDLDNFKTLNDTLLHKTGDKALQDVARILVNTFRKDDIVCRLGGDEFVVFLKNINFIVMEEKLKNLMTKLQLTYKEGDKQVKISASAGISFSPRDGSSFVDLYTKADSALYQAKKSGKSTFRYYEE